MEKVESQGEALVGPDLCPSADPVPKSADRLRPLQLLQEQGSETQEGVGDALMSGW